MAEPKRAGRPANKPKTTSQKSISTTENKIQVETSKSTTFAPAPKNIKIPLDYVIPVKSGVQGGLVYVSRKNGYEIVWDSYGDIEYLPYEEIVSMRNAHKRFFIDNWVFFEDTDDYTAEEIYKALMVDKYYKAILEIENIDELLMLDVTNLEKRIKNVPSGVKEAIVTRAKQLIVENNSIMDSISKREVIERVFDVELIPKEI